MAVLVGHCSEQDEPVPYFDPSRTLSSFRPSASYLREAIFRASAVADSFKWWSRWFITVTVK